MAGRQDQAGSESECEESYHGTTDVDERLNGVGVRVHLVRRPKRSPPGAGAGGQSVGRAYQAAPAHRSLNLPRVMGCGASTAAEEPSLKEGSLKGIEPAPQPSAAPPPQPFDTLLQPKPENGRSKPLVLPRTRTNSAASSTADWDAIGSPVPSPKLMAGQVADVDTWLKSIYMGEYADSFLAAGLTELSAVAKLTEEDLERAGVTKSGHKKKLQKQCAFLAQHLERTYVAPGLGRIEPADPSVDGGMLAPRVFLRSNDTVPEGLQHFTHEETRVRVFKSSYEANAPCEDRHTVVAGDGFIFAGVWDGHTGHYASEFAEEQIFVNFKRALDKEVVGTPRDGDDADMKRLGSSSQVTGALLETAFRAAYKATDRSFQTVTKRLVKRKQAKSISLFAGTCAVGAYIDLATRRVSVGNLGDSRAVVGLYEPTGLRTMIMSTDQTAVDDNEKVRLHRTHPGDKTIIINKGSVELPDWRVKGITQFTRSIGDWQMKDKVVAMLYNKYTKGTLVEPVPGSRVKQSPSSLTGDKRDNHVSADPVTVKPYIIPTPDYKEQIINRGFVIIACDGLWDELSNEEATCIVAELLHDHPEPDADIAGMLIERSLLAAAHRVVKENPGLAMSIFADPEHPTVAELKALPVGKRQSSHRSNLHDDITAVIIVLGPADEKEVHPVGWTPRMLPLQAAKGRKRLETSAGDLLGFMAQNIRDETKEEEELREQEEAHTALILELIDVASSFSADHLRIIFDALDCNPRNGYLSREECGQLCEQVLGDAMGDDEILDIIYKQMDSDNTGDVSWENFLQFFRIDADSTNMEAGSAVHGFRKIYGLLAEIPLFEGASLAEKEDLARVLEKVRAALNIPLLHAGSDGAILTDLDTCLRRTVAFQGWRSSCHSGGRRRLHVHHRGRGGVCRNRRRAGDGVQKGRLLRGAGLAGETATCRNGQSAWPYDNAAPGCSCVPVARC
eukprot:COSAG05_NODE_651_length_8095_cov_17.048572_2_plen_959_part_00